MNTSKSLYNQYLCPYHVANREKRDGKMRVLFLHRSTLANISGGVAEFLHHLPMALNTHGVNSYLYSENKNAALSSPVTLQNTMQAYTGHYIKPALFTSKKSLQPIIDLCQLEKIDLIHAQGVYRTGFLALQVYKAIGIPYVVTSHADILAANSERMRRLVVKQRCKKVLKHAKAVTHLTPFMAEHSHRLYDTSEKSFTIGNGINYQEWQPYTKLPEKNYLIAIGRFEKGKGFEVLIDVFAQLLEKGHTTSLVLAGSGSLESTLRNKARQYGINIVDKVNNNENLPEKSIIFTGYIKGDIKKRFIAQSIAVLFATQPSEWEEAFGIVLLEAMAAKKIIIGSEIAATCYLRSLGLQAELVQPDNTFEWTHAIDRVLRSTEERKVMEHDNLIAIENFGWDIIAKQYHQVYTQLIDSR